MADKLLIQTDATARRFLQVRCADSDPLKGRKDITISVGDATGQQQAYRDSRDYSARNSKNKVGFIPAPR